MATLNFDAIPAVLKQYDQWVVWKYVLKDGSTKPTKPMYSPRTGNLVGHNPKDKHLWGTFEQVSKIAHKYDGIGFVLTAEDPFCVIDIDSPKSPSDSELQAEFFEKAQSYAEVSPSGNGAHIWLKGAITSGRKRYSTEIYSQLRYITVTGNPIRDTEIVENPEVIAELWDRLGGEKKSVAKAADVVKSEVGSLNTLSDNEVLDRAFNSANADKFRMCWEGAYHGSYPSQSESDFALIDMLAFWTRDDDQVRRIFLDSPAGHRDKATRNGKYVYNMIAKSRDKSFEPPIIDQLPLLANLAKRVDSMKAAKADRLGFVESRPAINGAEVTVPVLTVPAKTQHIFPPGLVGEIAQSILDYAPRPVPEIALMGAIGFMAGIAGRCYNVYGMGINMYLMMLAKSGVGKEAMKDGIDMLYTEIEKLGVKTIDFRGPMKINSEQALLHKLNDSRTKSFLSVYGEIGKDLKRMTSAAQNTSAVDMAKILLVMYSASGAGKQLDEMIYADKARNTDPIRSPGFSILGQSVPSQVYGAITEETIIDGLLPRFVVQEYDGDRNKLNHNMKRADAALVTKLSYLISNSTMLNENDKVINLKIDESTQKLIATFDEVCDGWINSTSNESIRALWGRVSVNTLKLASIIAVGRNYQDPVMTDDDFNWACAYVKRSVRLLISRLDSGELGGGTDSISIGKNQSLVMSAVNHWYTRKLTPADLAIKRYSQYREEGIVPLRYIQQRCAKMKTQELKNIIESLIKGGELLRINNETRKQLFAKYKWSNVWDVDIYTVSEDFKF